MKEAAMTTLTAAVHELDVKGLQCPMPIVKTAKAMRELASGDLIQIVATDPGSVKDFAAWSRATGNELVESSAIGGVFRFVMRKR
ncbi:MAG TPA: sulfurtransferase TusA family protein [Candidatus Limnocylindria bacterium]